ncbi:MAG: PrgI family protein [Patescibacteria group bacterium]
MEQHPVPQNVTTFQFRLIGDMTLKQFGYLCAGGVLAIIFYKLPLPFFFTWPLATAFALLGVGFAFVPIEERPMDVWVFSFFKSIYSPTQYIWQKGHAPIIAAPKISKMPPTQPSVSHIYAPPNTRVSSTQIKSVTGVKPPEPTPIPHTEAPIVPVVDNSKVLELEASIVALQNQLATKNIANERVLELQKQLTDVLQDKTHTEDELIALKRKIENTTLPPVLSPPATQTNTVPTVRPFNSVDAGVRAGIPRFTSVPNVVTGIVKDDSGDFLPAILITVTNTDGIPMRALKTNKLGQLAASTPLPNGVYLIEIEDPRGRYTFDRVQVTLNGSVVPALEIIAKSQKQVTREKLAQDIFGKPPM